jgi:molecular chaperone IbpA
MQTTLSLSPLFRQTVGFDRFSDLFESLSDQDNRASFPPYDIVKTSEHRYQIIMAIAGYQEADVSINVEKDMLNIAGASEPENDKLEFIHRGIAKRHFSRSFRIADHMQVEKADMNNGMLTIDLFREIPEQQKPRTIAINQSVN